MTRATVITDASFCADTRSAGWAAWIKGDDGLSIQRSGTFNMPPASSLEAETWAAANGVFLAVSAGARVILLQTDCMTVVHGVQKKGRQAPKIWRKNLKMALETLPYAVDLQLSARHVKGHTRDGAPRSWVNRWCDKHARRAMKEQRRSAA
ncbi:MAG: reverse transcriptase-like protein [Pseudomonadota bacterium]